MSGSKLPVDVQKVGVVAGEAAPAVVSAVAFATAPPVLAAQLIEALPSITLIVEQVPVDAFIVDSKLVVAAQKARDLLEAVITPP